ncbi:MAG TPA: hypothetical protein VFB84_08380 [Micromonosporaceae bacterium]|nr:hypothetical protein [Micromonosporaceae bacterium]
MADRRDAVLDSRYATMVRSGLDLAGVATWDTRLSRRTRILVPADVQAFVVPRTGGEPTVPLTGGPGDPAPFAAGTVRAAGVHLHWAMPDALLSGRHDRAAAALALPALPDRWVVVRTLQPTGGRVIQARGWVIDAAAGLVTPLETYDGTVPQAPAGTAVLRPLDGAAGGSLMWTASYPASAGRFGFHDPLADIPAGSRFEADQAVYTVAGWWSDLGQDPLAAARGPAQLDSRLAGLGWDDGPDGEELDSGEEPVLARSRAEAGLGSPADSPPARVVDAGGRTVDADLHGIAVDVAVPVDLASEVVIGPALPRYATLVHGSVLGVPVTGALPAADDRPAASALGVALGQDIDDVASAFGASVLRLDPAHRRSAETLVAAFTSGLIEQLGTLDGLEDLAEREHGDGFWALNGTPLPAARPDRLRAEDSAPLGPLAVGRKGRAAQPEPGATKLEWGRPIGLRKASGQQPATGQKLSAAAGRPAEAREVERPAPRFFRPQPPVVALRGARPNHRHHGDGLYDDRGRLRCRYPKECVTEITGVVTGAAVLPSLGSGAVPAEVLLVVREAVLLNPYGYRWFTPPGPATTRIAAEMVRLYGGDGRYDGGTPVLRAAPGTAGGSTRDSASGSARDSASGSTRDPAGSTWDSASGSTWDSVSVSRSITDRRIDLVLADHSLLAGTAPSPVALTTWRQPWVPLWLEWRVTLDGRDSVEGWRLDGTDLEPTDDVSGRAVTMTLTGRSAIGQGVSRALHEGIRRWLDAERQRDATGASTLPRADQDDLSRLGDLMAPLDLVSASLDGVREQLLGIPYVGVVDRGPGTDPKPRATADPTVLFAGSLAVEALRLVDAFGRVLDVPSGALDATSTTAGLEVAGAPRAMRLRPRIQHLARWLFRLTDPAQAAAAHPDALHEAYVDQLDPAGAVNPVAGFLLPDHIDEELEAFTVAGQPVGSLTHEAVTGAVTWEPAPGRPLPPDAGPLAELDAHSRITGEIAAGLVLADAAARSRGAPPATSALSALLRAIDTTLWTVDTFAAVGTPTIAGLVGRPVAIVRASLRLDAPDDVAEVEVTAPGGGPARRAAFAALREQRFPVQLGTLTRTDDALLGFYVDDDYQRLHLVDRVVAAFAVASGRHRGHLGLLGSVTAAPVDPLDHPYLVPDATITIRPGQTVKLTLLMLPAGRVHLTSGVLPRKQIALSDEWVTPGLRRLVPSVRVGPVLVDPAEIRLPLVSLLGDEQVFTRRTGPLAWRHDPIVAATQSAYLPRAPHEAQEGWVRVSERDT